MAKIYEVEKGDASYTVVQMGQTLYRRERGTIATWKLVGGANPDTDYDRIDHEREVGGPCGARYDGFTYTRKGDRSETPIKLSDVARPVLSVGDKIVARPINSPRARETGLDKSPDAGVLSGRIKSIRTTRVRTIEKLI